MKQSIFRKGLSLILTLALTLSLFAGLALTANADEIWREQPTGYTKASDVVYVKDGTRVANWGVRGETATFLTSYAESYYTGNYTFEKLSANQGNANTASTPSSALYKALQSMLKSKQTSTTSYQSTRDLYKYTDCMVSNYSYISSFYSGRKLNGAWDSGKTWNREHTWPNSKISGNGENDIMMLRPTSVQENSDRGNKAYGESAGCYDPNVEATPNGFNVHGDCARIILYVYVRWGETNEVLNNMWGSSGVMESLDTLLKWMEEDPVDTWELGRNDAVQSITGARNVFVDYPELAWQLFGQQAPAGYPTPSGGAAPAHEHACALAEEIAPTCTEDGRMAYLYCAGCGKSFSLETYEQTGELVEITAADLIIPALGHDWGAWELTVPATATAPGEETRICARCKAKETREVQWTGCETKIEAVEFVLDETAGTSLCIEIFDDEALDYLTRVASIQGPDGDGDCVLKAGEHYTLLLGAEARENCCFAETLAVTVNGTLFTGEIAFDENRTVLTFTYGFTVAGQPAFADVPADAYFAAPVEWAVENGITNGTGANTFSPGKTCTRGQVVTFLWRASGSPAPQSTENPFEDVKTDDYFYQAVLWAKETGVTAGTSATKFSPNNGCTRGQVVTFLWRSAGSPAADEDELPIIPGRATDAEPEFTDVVEGAYYEQAVRWAVRKGITNGTSANTFSPDRTCTRGQVVTFLFRANEE